MVACRHDDGKGVIAVVRLERLMMDTPDEALIDTLSAFVDAYPTPLLSIYPRDERFMGMVADYRADSVVRMVDDTVRRYYADFSTVEARLYDALARAYKLDTAIRCSTFITYIGNGGYGSRVAADRESRTMTISIDEYVLPHMANFGYFGEPLYIVRQCRAENIAVDCMAELVRQHIAMPEGEPTLLDYMIAEGKVQYFLHKVMPHAADTLLFRYTDAQMQWMRSNEANVWAYFVQNRMLYEHDYNRLHNFIDDAPKTNAFQESAPRTVEYIGWQIVSRYAKRSGLSFGQLLDATDAQTILYQSGYKP